ncbi:MAG: 16S rRNA (guanine(527)-N(7))-methyltransferase RsmG [Coriobacteriia bacterium]|nr:16S rRNA (guanine(527)-N(7))-methyltransferase RsmG [Coriobacteriia bacterium]
MFHVEHQDRIAESIAAESRSLGVLLSEADSERLALHLELVLAANATTNLTAVTETREAIRLHVLDSLAAAPLLAAAPPGPFVDIGSGAGYPGIPLAIATGRAVTLLESNGKKARFLESVVSDLRLEANVASARAEEWALRMPEAYAAATARAVSSLASLEELAAPLLHIGGHLLALKGRRMTDEEDRARRAGDVVGLRLIRVASLSVPGADERTVYLFAKTGPPVRPLPRRPGAAQKRPLG